MAIRHKRKNSTGYTWQSGDLVEGQIGLNIADGTLHFKKSNGNYVALSTPTGITSVSQDTTPSLGGDLDVNGKKIISASNANITIEPNGTGDVYLNADTVRVGDSNADVTITTNGTGDLILNTNSGTNSGSIVIADAANGDITYTTNGTGVHKHVGAVQLNAQSELRLADSDSSNYVGFKSPATVSANKVWTLPSADGTSGQVLKTDGSATLSWTTPSTSNNESYYYAPQMSLAYAASGYTDLTPAWVEIYDNNANTSIDSTYNISVPAGTWYMIVEACRFVFGSGTPYFRIYNNTDSTTLQEITLPDTSRAYEGFVKTFTFAGTKILKWQGRSGNLTHNVYDFRFRLIKVS